MLKSCVYCGKVHPAGYDCPSKPRRIRKDKDSRAKHFRASTVWRKTAKRVLERDHYLCQACLHNLPGTIRKYNSEQLSVHHIIPLSEDYSKRLDESNLITLCSRHHAQADCGKIGRRALLRLSKIDGGVPPEGQNFHQLK